MHAWDSSTATASRQLPRPKLNLTLLAPKGNTSSYTPPPTLLHSPFQPTFALSTTGATKVSTIAGGVVDSFGSASRMVARIVDLTSTASATAVLIFAVTLEVKEARGRGAKRFPLPKVNQHRPGRKAQLLAPIAMRSTEQ